MYIFYETTNALDLPSIDRTGYNFKIFEILGDMPLPTLHRHPHLCASWRRGAFAVWVNFLKAIVLATTFPIQESTHQQRAGNLSLETDV